MNFSSRVCIARADNEGSSAMFPDIVGSTGSVFLRTSEEPVCVEIVLQNKKAGSKAGLHD
jgi:hypothetical protein